MIPDGALHLRDLIFAEAHARGLVLNERTVRIEHDIPVVRFRSDGVDLRRCTIRLPGGSYQTVITVTGSLDRWSRSWPRKPDGTFNIIAVADFLLALVEHERAQPRPPDLQVPAGINVEASGVDVVHLAAVRLGRLPMTSEASDLVGLVRDDKVRARIERRTQNGGLSETDLRALCDVVPLELWRPNKLDFDPFEPFGSNSLPVAVIGHATVSGVERRYVLVLDYDTDEVILADPAGKGLTTVTPKEFRASWKLGATRGRPWVGLVGTR